MKIFSKFPHLFRLYFVHLLTLWPSRVVQQSEQELLELAAGVLRHILLQLPAELIAVCTFDLLKLIECSAGQNLDQHRFGGAEALKMD